MNRVTVSTHSALEQLQVADEQWRSAMRGFQDFPARLRALATAAEDEQRALTMVSWANVSWRPVAGASKLKAPTEIAPDSERPGPPKLWAKFDAALQELGLAFEGDVVDAVIAAFRALQQAALEIADTVEQQQAAQPRRKAG